MGRHLLRVVRLQPVMLASGDGTVETSGDGTVMLASAGPQVAELRAMTVEHPRGNGHVAALTVPRLHDIKITDRSMAHD